MFLRRIPRRAFLRREYLNSKRAARVPASLRFFSSDDGNDEDKKDAGAFAGKRSLKDLEGSFTKEKKPFGRSETVADVLKDEEEDDDFFDKGFDGEEDDDFIDKEESDDENTKENPFAHKKGRIWRDPYEITDEFLESTQTFDDYPDWTPSAVSRVSQERVKLYPGGIPTLSELSKLPLPPEVHVHPGENQKAYNKYREREQYRYILQRVSEKAKPRLDAIFALESWEEKQDAVDELYESIEFELKDEEVILGRQPKFGAWVEEATEEFLRGEEQKYRELQSTNEAKESGSEDIAATDSVGKGTEEEDKAEEDAAAEEEKNDVAGKEEKGDVGELPDGDLDAKAEPIFMDCYDPEDGDEIVPKLLIPLRPHPRDGPGRVVEEWELSSHKKSKRILLRQSTRKIARLLEDSDFSRILITGRRGVGKTACALSIVASARKSGYIVLFQPDGNRLRELGFYVKPNPKREGIFDLPILTQDCIQFFLDVHEKDLQGMEVDEETMNAFFTDRNLERLEYTGGSMAMVDVLRGGLGPKSLAGGCFSSVMHCLKRQTEKPFLIVMDDYNCYFDRGHYFHMEYDNDVKKPIPYNQISLLQPGLDAMALSTAGPHDVVSVASEPIARGGVIGVCTKAHAVPIRVNEALEDYTQREIAKTDNLHICTVPVFSSLEMDHIIANFEATGVGKLCLDQGDTVMDKGEVEFLKTLSGGVGQELLDACIF